MGRRNASFRWMAAGLSCGKVRAVFVYLRWIRRARVTLVQDAVLHSM